LQLAWRKALEAVEHRSAQGEPDIRELRTVEGARSALDPTLDLYLGGLTLPELRLWPSDFFARRRQRLRWSWRWRRLRPRH
jgi:hypothetical protein